MRLLTFHGLNPSTRCPRSFTEVTKPAELGEWECRGLFNGLWGCFCHFSCQARRTNVKQPLCFQAVANCRGTFLSSAHTKTDNIQHNIQHMRAMLENKEPWGRNSIRLCVCCVCFGRLECTLMLILYMWAVCAQLRCGVLPLALETARFQTKIESVSCVTWQRIHFLFYCPIYNLRYQLFHEMSAKCPDLFSMSDVSSQNQRKRSLYV